MKESSSLYSENSIQSLDILLIKGTARSSKINVFGQRLFSRNRKAKYSHVAISLGMNLFVHSDKSEKGVKLVPFYHFFDNSEYKQDYTVIRNKTISKQFHNKDLDPLQVYQDALYYLDQSYNSKFTLRNNANKSKFCSELATILLNKYGVSVIEDLEPFKTFPSHFELLESSDNWKDVTYLYQKVFGSNTQIESLKSETQSDREIELIIENRIKTEKELYEYEKILSSRFIKEELEHIKVEKAQLQLDKTLLRLMRNLNMDEEKISDFERFISQEEKKFWK